MAKQEPYERLATLYKQFKEKGYTQHSFGEILGITQAQLSRLLRGESGITRQHELLLENQLGLNIKWLQTGRGPIFLESSEEKRLDDLARKLVKLSEGLNKENRDTLYILSESLIKKQKGGKKPKKIIIDRAAEPVIKYET